MKKPTDYKTVIENKIRNIYGERAGQILESASVKKPTTFRENFLASKGDLRRVIDLEVGYKAGPLNHSFIKNSNNEVDLAESLLYQNGNIYVQELSSQIPPFVLNPQPDEYILDLCAAPGSKTTQIASLVEMGRQGLGEVTGNPKIIAVEKNKPRFFLLKHNVEMQKAGDKVKLILSDGIGLYKRYPEFINYFSKVLVDAPCSNEGSINLSNPKSYKFWNPYKWKEMSRIQKGLLISGYRMLKPGGVLVYSTCTFSVEENEAVVDWLLKKEPEASVEEITLPIKNVVSGRTTWQGKGFSKDLRRTKRILPTELFTAFYIAKIRKQKGQVG